jgi:hypothetical protein
MSNYGHTPRSFLTESKSSNTLLPNTVAVPSVGSIIPESMLIVVVFPAPL